MTKRQRENARKIVRQAIRQVKGFRESCQELEFLVLGGFAFPPTKADVDRIEETCKPENVEAWIEEHKNDFVSLDDIIKGAACDGEFPDHNYSDEYIDSVIDEIIETYKDVPIEQDDSSVKPFDPDLA